jgi:hypothetical protein
MNDEPKGARGEDFIAQIRARYPAEFAEKLIAHVQRRDDLDNAEAATNDATFWAEMEFGYHTAPVDLERAFQDLDRLLEHHPDYFDIDDAE